MKNWSMVFESGPVADGYWPLARALFKLVPDAAFAGYVDMGLDVGKVANRTAVSDIVWLITVTPLLIGPVVTMVVELTV